MNVEDRIEAFLGGSPFAVVGASQDRAKYGNKVLRAYLQNKRTVYAIHPETEEVEGLKVYRSLAEVPEAVHGVSIVTPPSVTESIVEQAGQLQIKNVWMQPGAENDVAIRRAEELGMNVIAAGPCILVALRFRE